MSYMRTGILGVIAVSASFGAVQLASGHDLDFTLGLKAFAAIPTEGVTPAQVVNRPAKADRVAGAVAPAETTQTISIHVDRIADSSVLVRIPRPQQAASKPSIAEEVCSTLEQAAAENGLPVDFFVRVIWQESRFNAVAVSPKGAKGIAQFTPGTAEWRGLNNPFDVIAALKPQPAI